MATEKKSFDSFKKEQIETAQVKGGSNSRSQDLAFDGPENKRIVPGKQQSLERNSERTSDSL